MASFSRSVFKILCAAVFVCSFKAAAADDAYLKMLEGEAEDLKLDQSGQIKDKPKPSNMAAKNVVTSTNWTAEGELDVVILPPGLSQDEFTTILKQNFYGTFVFFRKLSSVDQATVFYHYSKSVSAELDSIRQDILNHLKNKGRS